MNGLPSDEELDVRMDSSEMDDEEGLQKKYSPPYTAEAEDSVVVTPDFFLEYVPLLRGRHKTSSSSSVACLRSAEECVRTLREAAAAAGSRYGSPPKTDEQARTPDNPSNKQDASCCVFCHGVLFQPVTFLNGESACHFCAADVDDHLVVGQNENEVPGYGEHVNRALNAVWSGNPAYKLAGNAMQILKRDEADEIRKWLVSNDGAQMHFSLRVRLELRLASLTRHRDDADAVTEVLRQRISETHAGTTATTAHHVSWLHLCLSRALRSRAESRLQAMLAGADAKREQSSTADEERGECRRWKEERPVDIAPRREGAVQRGNPNGHVDSVADGKIQQMEGSGGERSATGSGTTQADAGGSGADANVGAAEDVEQQGTTRAAASAAKTAGGADETVIQTTADVIQKAVFPLLKSMFDDLGAGGATELDAHEVVAEDEIIVEGSPTKRPKTERPHTSGGALASSSGTKICETEASQSTSSTASYKLAEFLHSVTLDVDNFFKDLQSPHNPRAATETAGTAAPNPNKGFALLSPDHRGAASWAGETQQALLDRFEEDLSCPVCAEIFLEPCTLPCGHTMCRLCLSRHLDHALERAPICVMCRHPLIPLLVHVNSAARRLHTFGAQVLRQEMLCRALDDGVVKKYFAEKRRLRALEVAEAETSGTRTIAATAAAASGSRCPAGTGNNRKTPSGGEGEAAARATELLVEENGNEGEAGHEQSTSASTPLALVQQRQTFNQDVEPAPHTSATVPESAHLPGEKQEQPLPEQESVSWIPVFVCSVAVPGVSCGLHVFEPRYRLMMRRCMDNEKAEDRCFGMHPHSATPFGCLLRITDYEQLPDGRSRIETVGVRRYRVLEWGEKDAYSIARVEWVDDVEEEEDKVIGERDVRVNAEDLQNEHNAGASAPGEDAGKRALSSKRTTSPAGATSEAVGHRDDGEAPLPRLLRDRAQEALARQEGRAFLSFQGGRARIVTARDMILSQFGPMPPDNDANFVFWLFSTGILFDAETARDHGVEDLLEFAYGDRTRHSAKKRMARLCEIAKIGEKGPEGAAAEARKEEAEEAEKQEGKAQAQPNESRDEVLGAITDS
eukprot:CAMPEP_0179007572 /NCGR_PEP_ID=MMETSP0795-20121207/15234_1 /TAXON_ID=88552 /ORGANISM="Amoebophrya sp., Strain Ameob2" /LENGTH=1083 /DNA_ID=CAMNT_0020702559 /DNA_START=272 /DNA_END=3524 /DNA_ORIENTATION=-